MSHIRGVRNVDALASDSFCDFLQFGKDVRVQAYPFNWNDFLCNDGLFFAEDPDVVVTRGLLQNCRRGEPQICFRDLFSNDAEFFAPDIDGERSLLGNYEPLDPDAFERNDPGGDAESLFVEGDLLRSRVISHAYLVVHE